MIHLILGGARSGKSNYAEQQALVLAETGERPLCYLATGSAGDVEMRERINHHRQSRSPYWQLTEEPLYLSKALFAHHSAEHIVLVDCLTLWISNWLGRNDQQAWHQEQQEFLSTLAKCEADILLVSNEVGSGIVPLGQLSRDFVDEAGRLHQHIARMAQQVTLVVAGLPLRLKPTP